MIQKKYSILLVEDNPGDIRLFQEVLKDASFKYDLVILSSGADVMPYLMTHGNNTATKRPQMIFMDLNLPKLNGIELIQSIKKDESLKKIPIIVLSTSNSDKDIESSYAAHANCYLTKPMNFEEFSQVFAVLEKFWFEMVQLP